MSVSRKAVLSAALVLALLAALWLLKRHRRGPFALEPRGAPVVVLVVIDTLRADRTSLCGYRYPTTPNLQRLVEDGASYACDAHSPSTWTLPSHASFFTGVGLDGHRAGSGSGAERMRWGAVTPLSSELPTLAEEMAARGYQTLFLSGNPVVSERMGLTRGFDHVAIGRTYPMMHDHRLASRLRGLLRVSKLDRKRPLFAFINIADPHSPWTEVPESVGFLPPRSAMDAQPERRRYESGEMTDREAEQWLAHLSDVYDYAVLRADRSLSLILEVLESRGWFDQSYRLIITSDHGEYLGEHRMAEHGRSLLYEPVTRVPFLYFSTDGTLDLPDAPPSIIAYWLARDGTLPVPPPASIASAFRRYPPRNPRATPPCTYARSALWDGATKLVADNGRVVRFDRDEDPEEMAPRPADEHPAAPALLEHCRDLDRAYLERSPVDPEIEAEITAQLKALGYLQDDDKDPSKDGPEGRP